MKKECKICGKKFLTLQFGGNRLYCFECVPQTDDWGKRTLYKRQALKREGVRRLGGKCLKCGETRPHILNFHHIIPEEKTAAPAQLLADSKVDEFFEEIDKCILLCSNCHGDFHFLNENYNISINEYLNQDIMELKQKEINEKKVQLQQKTEEVVNKIKEWQQEQEQKTKEVKHIYQGKVIAYTDNWLQEFESVNECAKYIAIQTNQTIDNCRDGIRRVLNGKRHTYHKYRFKKAE